jgi:hypothetical protein
MVGTRITASRDPVTGLLSVMMLEIATPADSTAWTTWSRACGSSPSVTSSRLGDPHGPHEEVEHVRLGDDADQAVTLGDGQGADLARDHDARRLLDREHRRDGHHRPRHDVARAAARGRLDVAVGDDPDETPLIEDRQVADPASLEQAHHVGERGVGIHRHHPPLHHVLDEHHRPPA